VLAKMLTHQRVDLVIAATAGFESAMRRTSPKIQYEHVAYKHAPSTELYLLISKKADIANKSQLIKRLTQVLSSMEQDKTIEAIYQQYGHSFQSTP